MVQFASYLRRVLCKTRLIFPRINGRLMLPALDLHLTFFGFRFLLWSLVGACIAQLSYAIVECLGYLFCLLDAFPFQFTIAMGSMKARQKPRNTATKFEVIKIFLIFVGVI